LSPARLPPDAVGPPAQNGPVVRVTVRSRRSQPLQGLRPTTVHDVHEQTELGEVLLRSLIRAQLSVALRILAALVAVMVGIPALFELAPGVARYRVLGAPIAWIVLGGAFYPLMWLTGRFYVRAVERNEREFVEVVERS
jgi:hypothetical protein